MDKIILEISVWLRNVISYLVSNPDDIKVDGRQDEMGLFFVISVNPADTGVLVGKGGENVQALKTILRRVGWKNDIRAALKIK